MKKARFVMLVLLFLPVVLLAQGNGSREDVLYELLMNYRKSFGLPEIPRSVALTQVARLHVRDLSENHPDKGGCNLHSWSAHGTWSACCYTDDHSQASCMWNKPRELTKYKGHGFEIAHWSSQGATPESAINGWKSSRGHNAVILNQGIWNERWNAIGIGISDDYAVVWFGTTPDP